MKEKEFLQKILDLYRPSFDIGGPVDAGGRVFDAYASFNMTEAKYVLVKKAELWRTDCFEHVFFMCTDRLRMNDAEGLEKGIREQIEPVFVRKGKKYPEKDHMYTYITFIFISGKRPEKDVQDRLEKFRYMKDYCLGIRGYCEARTLIFDLEDRRMTGNRAARELLKGYGKIGDLFGSPQEGK